MIYGCYNRSNPFCLFETKSHVWTNRCMEHVLAQTTLLTFHSLQIWTEFMSPGEIPLPKTPTPSNLILLPFFSSGETSTSVYPELTFCYQAVCLQEPIGNCNVAMCSFDFVFSSKMGVADTMWIASSEALTLTEVRASLSICNGHASFWNKCRQQLKNI